MKVSSIDVDVDVVEKRLMDRYGHITVSIEWITPEIAEEYLSANKSNRRINKHHLARLCNTLAAGDMTLNGETIIFSIDKRLLDGQHRLTACVRERRAFACLVVRGIEDDAFDTIDGGLVRGVHDVLGMADVPDATKTSGAIQAFVSFCDNGGFLVGSCTLSGVRKSTPRLAFRVLEAHPGLRDSVRAMSKSNLMRTQHGFALHYLFSIVSKRLSRDFADVLANGAPDNPMRPFNVLRESLVRSPMRTHNREQYASKAVIAFNAELSGDRLKNLRVGHGRPMISGLDVNALIRSIS